MQIYAIRFIVSFLKRSRFLDGILLNRSWTKTRLLDKTSRIPLVTEDVNASNVLGHEFCIRFIATFHGIFFLRATSSLTRDIKWYSQVRIVDGPWWFRNTVFSTLSGWEGSTLNHHKKCVLAGFIYFWRYYVEISSMQT